jgi:hypothetical protein
MISGPVKKFNTACDLGWRSFMQGTSDSHEKDLSRLAHAFLLVKPCRTFDARKELDAARQTFSMDEATTDQQRSNLILVDAHVRTYEDGPITYDAAKLK